MAFPKSSDAYLKELARKVAQKDKDTTEFPPAPDDVSLSSDEDGDEQPKQESEPLKRDESQQEPEVAPQEKLPALDSVQIESALDESTALFAQRTLKSIHTYYLTLAGVYLATKLAKFALPYVSKGLAWLGRAFEWLVTRFVSLVDWLCLVVLCLMAAGTGMLVLMALAYGPMKGQMHWISVLSGASLTAIVLQGKFARTTAAIATTAVSWRIYSKPSMSFHSPAQHQADNEGPGSSKR